MDTHTYNIIDNITITTQQSANFNLAYNIGIPSNSPYQKELDLKILGPNSEVSHEDSTREKFTADSSIKPGEKIQYQVTRTVHDSGIKYI